MNMYDKNPRSAMYRAITNNKNTLTNMKWYGNLRTFLVGTRGIELQLSSITTRTVNLLIMFKISH